jgi:Fe-S cluster assembly protein SufD
MTAVAERTDSWLAQFRAQKPAAPWIEQLRRSAFARFSALGFPTLRNEDWRFTNVAPLANTVFGPAPAIAVDADALAPFTKGTRFLFVNGRMQESPSALPKGLIAGGLTSEAKEYLAKDMVFELNAFVALNTAFFEGATFLRIAADAVIEEPIHLVYVTVPGAVPAISHPRTLMVVGPRARCTLVETFWGTGTYFNNCVTEIVAEAAAIVNHYKVQRESVEAHHIATLQTELWRDARYSTTSISLGGSLVRNNSNVRLAEGSDATLNGLYMVKGTQHVDNQLTVDHARPNASSHELYKGILDDRATAAFNGRILVRRDAQKTDAKQTNKNLLLSDTAVIDTKPELQILADDVRCTHGATIGQLDAEAAFYLQSRGIGRLEARSLLTYAFAQDVIDRVEVPSLREALARMVYEKLYDGSH